MLALTTVFKKSCLDEVGSFSEKFRALSDWDLWIRLAAKWPVICVPEPLALYRVHGNNTWHSLVENGSVEKERLQLLVNASRVLRERSLQERPSREVIGAKFAD